MTINFNYWKTRVVRYPLLAIAGIAAVTTTGLKFDLDKSQWAYWVQAVGSIAAILGAYYLGERNVARTKRDHLAALLAICDVAYERIDLVEHVYCASASKSTSDCPPETILAIVNALDRIPVHEIGNREAIMKMFELRDVLQVIAICIKTINTPIQVPEFGDSRGKLLYVNNRRAQQVQDLRSQIDIARPYYRLLASSIRAM